MMNRSYDCAIVGAGPTGLTLANILGAAGCRVLVIERHAHTVQEPRAVSIDDESLRTMQAIGLSDEMMPDIALDYGSHYFTSSGTLFAKVEPTTREYGFPRRNAFTQPKLEATLRRGLARFPNVDALFAHHLEGFQVDTQGVVLALRTSEGSLLSAKTAYLVGCDGARSAVRKAIGSTLTGSSYDQPWLIVDLARTREQLRQTRVVCNPARPVITLPGPHGIRRYEFMLHPGEDQTEAVRPANVRQLLAASGPDADMPTVRCQVYTFHARIADHWRKDRVLLAGDAAHLSPPFAGQGMNSGIRDAHNLGWKLAAVVRGSLGEDLLDTYEMERAPHAWALIELAIRMGRVMMPTSSLQARLVQLAFRLTRFAPRLHDYFSQMKYKPKPFYRTGFIVAQAEADLAGRMIPQPLVECHDRRRVMLDDLLGSGFALVVYGRDAEAAAEAATRLDFGIDVPVRWYVLPSIINPAPDAFDPARVVRDVNNTMAQFVRNGQTVAMVVRPDRYVCAAAAVPRLQDLAEATRSLTARFRARDPIETIPTAVLAAQ